MQRFLPILLGVVLVLGSSMARAGAASDAEFERLRNAILFPPNTTDISPDLYVRHRDRKPGDPPRLAHCRQMNVEVNGHVQSRRQCVTPADNY